MKKILIVVLSVFLGGFLCYATDVGERIQYRANNIEYGSSNSYVSKVKPSDKQGFYDVEITDIIQPAGKDSAVGVFVCTSNYILKQGDEITLYIPTMFAITPKKLYVSSISNNKIEFTSK